VPEDQDLVIVLCSWNPIIMATIDLDGPALAPPKGEVSNLNDPPNQNGLAYTVLIICAVITTICFLLRAYGRVYLLKKFQTEESE
jgi:hypothetical protein